MRQFKLILIFTIAILTIVIASCTPVNYQLSTSSTPNNGGTVSPNDGTYKKGTEVTLVATPANYYKFNVWAGDTSGTTDRITIKMDSNKNIVASFTKILYSLQLNVSTTDSGTLDPNSGNYEAGNQIKITATPANGFRFDHWGGSASGNTNPVNILIDTNKTITAYFTKQYTLKVSSNPSDGGVITPGTGVYDAGTQVKLMATQSFPYAFNNWTGTDNENVNPTTVTMSTDKTVTCNFVKLTNISEWKEENGPVYSGNSVTIPIQLNQFEYAEGDIMGGIFRAYIQDPTGTTIKDFGTIQTTNFLITALVPGRYTIVLQNSNSLQNTAYKIKYRFYRR